MANKYDTLVRKLEGYDSDNYLTLKIEGRLSEYKPPDAPLEEAHFKKIETQLGYSLPDDYREFLRDYGGFVFDGVSFPLPDLENWKEAGLEGFDESSDAYTLADAYYDTRRNWGEIDTIGSPEGFEWYPGLRLVRHQTSPIKIMNWPEELLPIAYNGGGNSICLALFGLRPGAVFYFRSNPHEGDENMYLAANSFDEFMHLLELRK